ncbi:MAG: serine/threonine-protein kinase PknK [Bradymonadaceae bacterium]|nr:serine/threonine-protein kinase PknK [Lujinxingiaceae bacterium]
MSRTQRLAQPEEFGKYHLIAHLAHGRMADVYKAKSHGVEGFEKILVVKVIHAGFGAIPEFVETLIEEAKRSVSLSHANVAQVYDLGQEDAQRRFYVAMEYVNGLDMMRAMTTAKRLDRMWPTELSVFIASEIAKGLDYAHRRKDFNFNSLNIVHRSLCPQNVMLSYDGEVKLTDFGISRAMDLVEAIDDDDINRRYLYAAPEVARGEEYTRQSDLFSLGLVLYEALTGVHPYFDQNSDIVTERARSGQIAPVTNYVDLPRPLVQILESLLVHDPAGRASSAGDVYEELIGYLFGNNLKADNRALSLAMQELRRHEQKKSPEESTQEVGLEEISLQELQNSFQQSEAYFEDSDETGTGEISEATKGALPSKMAKLFKGNDGGDAQQPPLPGALEDYFRSASGGRGKAVLLSGRLGSGRQYLPDRLVDNLGWRGNTKAFAIQPTVDDRYRPFGVLSDLILRCLHQTVAETLDHRESALQVLRQLRVSEEGIAILAGLWNMKEAPRLGYAERRRHLTQLFLALMRDLSQAGPLVLVVDRIERVDALTLDVLRDVVAEIGRLPVMLILGTYTDEITRAAFDTGRPEDLEAVRVSGPEPPPLEELAQLGEEATQVLTVLALSEQLMSQADLGMLLNIETNRLLLALRELTELGAVRVPRPGLFIVGLVNLSLWAEERLGRAEVERFASIITRYYTHRVVRGEIDRLTPSLIRLNALGGDRRRMLSLVNIYGQWLEQEGWHQSALDFYKQAAALLAHESLGAPHVRIDHILSAAELALELSQLHECRTILQPLAAICETVRNERGLVRGQLLMGQMAMQQDDLEDALTYFRRGATAARGLNDPDLLARALLALAGWHERYGDQAAAQNTLEGAINLFSRWGTRRMDLSERAAMLHRAVRMWAERGMLRRAEQPMSDLRTLAINSKLPVVECRADWAEAKLMGACGRHDEALRLFGRAAETAERFGLQALLIELIRERAAAALAAGDEETAWTIAGQLIGFAGQVADYYSEQRGRDIKATAGCILGRDVAESLAHLQSSLARAQDRRVPKDIYRCHDLLERALSALGKHDDAGFHRAQAAALAESMRYRMAG